MRGNVFVFTFIVFWNQVHSIRILELRAPGHAAEGHSLLLGCQFVMDGEPLYAVKWYKDNREFFRYVPKNKRHFVDFSTPGVTVDLKQSSRDEVALLDLTQQSAGKYRCEVSGEAPTFTTVSAEKYIDIQFLPERTPQLTGLQKHYSIGDYLLVNCSSSGSKPETKLKWLLNENPVPREYLQGPWYRISKERPDAMETILQIRFTVQQRHFKDGLLELKCHATIAPLYKQEAIHRAVWMNPPTPKPNNIHQSAMKEKLIDVYNSQKGVMHIEMPDATQKSEDDKDHAAAVRQSLWLLSAALLFLIL